MANAFHAMALACRDFTCFAEAGTDQRHQEGPGRRVKRDDQTKKVAVDALPDQSCTSAMMKVSSGFKGWNSTKLYLWFPQYRGTPMPISSILIGFSLINHPAIGVPLSMVSVLGKQFGRFCPIEASTSVPGHAALLMLPDLTGSESFRSSP